MQGRKNPLRSFSGFCSSFSTSICLGGLGSRVCLTARMEQGTFNNCLSCPEIFVLEIRRLLPRSCRTMGTRPTLKMLPLPVRQARQAFDREEDVRKFVPPLINFESNRFCDMVDLDSAEKTEPPVTCLPDEVILSALTAPLILPAFPNNT